MKSVGHVGPNIDLLTRFDFVSRKTDWRRQIKSVAPQVPGYNPIRSTFWVIG